jgi:hypothetical protein
MISIFILCTILFVLTKVKLFLWAQGQREAPGQRESRARIGKQHHEIHERRGKGKVWHGSASSSMRSPSMDSWPPGVWCGDGEQIGFWSKEAVSLLFSFGTRVMSKWGVYRSTLELTYSLGQSSAVSGVVALLCMSINVRGLQHSLLLNLLWWAPASGFVVSYITKVLPRVLNI